MTLFQAERPGIVIFASIKKAEVSDFPRRVSSKSVTHVHLLIARLIEEVPFKSDMSQGNDGRFWVRSFACSNYARSAGGRNHQVAVLLLVRRKFLMTSAVTGLNVPEFLGI